MHPLISKLLLSVFGIFSRVPVLSIEKEGYFKAFLKNLYFLTKIGPLIKQEALFQGFSPIIKGFSCKSVRS
jgi:hypothetical protein